LVGEVHTLGHQSYQTSAHLVFITFYGKVILLIAVGEFCGFETDIQGAIPVLSLILLSLKLKKKQTDLTLK
jgi:hypothetical protein